MWRCWPVRNICRESARLLPRKCHGQTHPHYRTYDFHVRRVEISHSFWSSIGFVMAYQLDSDDDCEVPDESGGKRWILVFVTVAGLAMIGVASAFAWRVYGGSPYPTFALGSSSATEPKMDGFDEFRAFQQQVLGQIQSNAQLLAAQQVESKRLSDQIALLSAKIDAIQSSISSARAAVPAATLRQPKKPAKPTPSARISTGGAPLPPPTQLTR
jgi:uncharacterized coiled-coil protein SlyX